MELSDLKWYEDNSDHIYGVNKNAPIGNVKAMINEKIYRLGANGELHILPNDSFDFAGHEVSIDYVKIEAARRKKSATVKS